MKGPEILYFEKNQIILNTFKTIILWNISEFDVMYRFF